MVLDLKGRSPRILIMTAVEAEREAVLRGLKNNSCFDVCLAGVGPILAAVNTTKILAVQKYDLVISAGIGGGFANKAEVGSLVIANEIIAADLGVETSNGFSSIDELGFGTTHVSVDMDLVNRLLEEFQGAEVPVNIGPVLTVSTVTGTAESAAEMTVRVPEATAEGMEGFGVALAAKELGVPILELRTISNAVGPRDREAWKIKEALEVLEKTSQVLAEVLK